MLCNPYCSLYPSCPFHSGTFLWSWNPASRQAQDSCPIKILHWLHGEVWHAQILLFLHDHWQMSSFWLQHDSDGIIAPRPSAIAPFCWRVLLPHPNCTRLAHSPFKLKEKRRSMLPSRSLKLVSPLPFLLLPTQTRKLSRWGRCLHPASPTKRMQQSHSQPEKHRQCQEKIDLHGSDASGAGEMLVMLFNLARSD